MTNSNNAHDYGSWLNFIPVGPDGCAIELSPVNKGEYVRWHWSARLGIVVTRCISEKSFTTREEAFEDAHGWWGRYSEYCGTLRDRTPSLMPCLNAHK